MNNPQYSGNQNKQKETTFREKSGRKHIIENSNEKVIENKNYEENIEKNTRVHTGESQKNYAENIERDNTGVKQKENDNRTNLKEQVLTKIRNSNTQEINANENIQEKNKNVTERGMWLLPSPVRDNDNYDEINNNPTYSGSGLGASMTKLVQWWGP